jgi:hypothetical protein
VDVAGEVRGGEVRERASGRRGEASRQIKVRR